MNSSKEYYNFLLTLGSILNVDNIHEWFGEVRERLTHTLDDKSFEHDTQAASGSTTGDWFILLYARKDISI
jgi:hypothetical protein